MANYEKHVYTPGSLGRPAGIWKAIAPYKLSTGTLCERYILIAPDDEKNILGHVYVYRYSAKGAPVRAQYSIKGNGYKLQTITPPSALSARYKVEQYAINIKIAEMREAAEAAEEAAKAAGNTTPQAGTEPVPNGLQKYVPFLTVVILTEILVIILAYVARGTS